VRKIKRERDRKRRERKAERERKREGERADNKKHGQHRDALNKTFTTAKMVI
jgi:hypothetical protein